MKLTTVYFRWSASEVISATFVKWQRKLYPKDYNGDRKSGWWGIGTVVKSELFNWRDARRSSRREGLPPLHIWLAPHTELYASYEDARRHRNPLPRPSMQEYLVLRKWA